MSRGWQEDGAGFTLDWGGLTWRLDLASATPGLVAGQIGPLLALDGVAERGRTEPSALSSESMVSVERHFDWVDATYAPPGWGDLTVRARWKPVGELGVDLEVQLLARSVGELNHVEVKTLSQLAGRSADNPPRAVIPRDSGSAALSYDGRERDVSWLSTSPPDQEPALWLVPKSGREGWTYLEMVHPEDASRRIFEGTLPYAVLRTGLFGYDLERGVVLRGRLRGVWLPKDRAFSESPRLYREFLAEPLPLST